MSAERVDVVFLNPWERRIGPNRYLAEMLRQLPELAARSLVASDHLGEAAGEYRGLGCRTAVWPEIRLVRAGYAPHRLAALGRDHTLGLARLATRLRRLQPRLVVSNTEILWLGGMAARLLRVPHVQVFHAMTVFDRLGRRPLLLRAYLRWLGLWSSRFLTVSRAQAAALAAGGVAAARIRVVPNPIPVAEIERQAARGAPGLEATIGERSPALACAGRICPIKGQDLLVEALPAVREDFPDLVCLFAGRLGASAVDGETEAFDRRLRRRVSELGLDDHVVFLGEVTELPALLGRAALYVQPSRSESFGRVVAEAQVCGTPVVAFATGGLAEVAGPSASLVAPGNVGALGEAIRARLAEPPAARAEAARRGREHVARGFDAPRVARRFAEVLDEVGG